MFTSRGRFGHGGRALKRELQAKELGSFLRLRFRLQPGGELQPRIDRLAFQGQDAEDAFVDAAQGLAADEALQGFEAQGELAAGQGALGPGRALAAGGAECSGSVYSGP